VIGKEQAVDELYGAIQKAATSLQPIIIVDDAPEERPPSTSVLELKDPER